MNAIWELFVEPPERLKKVVVKIAMKSGKLVALDDPTMNDALDAMTGAITMACADERDQCERWSNYVGQLASGGTPAQEPETVSISVVRTDT